jgi:hypothetical protein
VAKIAYPGCTTNDFVIGKYAIAGCNVGSNEAGTGVNSY